MNRKISLYWNIAVALAILVYNFNDVQGAEMSLQIELSNDGLNTVTSEVKGFETMATSSTDSPTTSITTSIESISSIVEVVTQSLSPTSNIIATTSLTSSTKMMSSISLPPTQVATTPQPTPVRQPRLYPYGKSQGDASIYKSRWSVVPGQRFQLRTPIYFLDQYYNNFRICSNGYVAFKFQWCTFWPTRFRTYYFPLLAPFFMSADYRAKNATVYYHGYYSFDRTSQSKAMLDKATRDVNEFQQRMKAYAANHTPQQVEAEFGHFHTQVPNFVATSVIVITWAKIAPYPYYYNSYGFTNTFQLVLVSNGQNTFTLWNYEYEGMQWWKINSRSRYFYFYGRPRTGYAKGAGKPIHHEIAGSGSRQLFLIDSRVGNTNKTGQWAFRLDPAGDHISHSQKCLAWFFNQHPLNYYTSFMQSPCPCSWIQVFFDRRFTFWGRVARFPCAQTRFAAPTIGSFLGDRRQRMHRVCCYSFQRNRFGALVENWPDGGTLTYANRQLRNIDQDAYLSCCVKSPLCRLYYSKRRSGSCRGYIPPRRTWFAGDPHIKTLDGKTYTFNGLGEYTLVNVNNNYLVVQARTARALVNGTQSASATVFTAFSAKQNGSDIIQGTLDLETNNFTILVNSTMSLAMTNLSVNVSREYNNVDLSLSRNGSLIVAFSSGVSLEVTPLVGMINIAVNIPTVYRGQTRGLLGVWNGKMEDDFTRPDDTVVEINSTESQIFYQFGQAWQISQSQSLFTYPPGTTHANFTDLTFVPVFSDNITALFGDNTALLQQAQQACGNDLSCLYDASQTLDIKLAVQAKENVDSFNSAEKQAENFPPDIVGPAVLNVTFGQTLKFIFNVTDRNPDDTTIIDALKLPNNATLNQAINEFQWTVTQYTNFSIQVVAKDSNDAVSIYQPAQVIMCHCANGGQCDYSAEFVDDGFASQVPCRCLEGWTGDHCTIDFDSCSVAPCFENVTCTDHKAPLSGFTCGSCPSGLTGDGRICTDIDECANSTTHTCQQICINTFRSYICDCQPGYRLNANGKACDDIDECFNPKTCSQNCQNLPGSFECSCDPGFTLSSDNSTCNVTIPCNGTNSCSHICVQRNGTDYCACRKGYALQSDGKSCADINECTANNNLCQMICNNTIGGFHCQCSAGYKLHPNSRNCTGADAYQVTATVNGTFNPQYNDKTSAAYKSAVIQFQNDILLQYQRDTRTSNTVKAVTITNLRQGSIIIDFVLTLLQNYTSGTPTLKSILDTNPIGDHYVQSSAVSDFNECSSSQYNNCTGGQQCTNTVGSYNCSCRAGFTFNIASKLCIDLNECSAAVKPCHVNATCTNTNGSYTCACNSHSAGDGKTCTLVCFANTCNNGGTCYASNGAAQCNCTQGVSGNRCQNLPTSVGTIVGIAVGSVVGVLVIVAIAVFVYKHNQKKTLRSVTPEQNLLPRAKAETPVAFENQHGQQEGIF
ncbi:Mucin-like protein [Trichoplax sp. H2]|nr:Mucin-like protein [Trichoplax sp. H2]|eukprot:RDD36690.1 Mucin-like protein [Trichoplax sp. H2]